MPEQHFQSNAPLPPGNQIYLERPHIDHLLKEMVKNPVVVVMAGAGYGKTQAVYSFVRKYTAQTSWIQLSERDNISERFWENFIAGVALIDKKAALTLRKIDFPETERQFERYVSIPRAVITADTKIIFVFDDFHLIHNKAVLRFIERSITAPFPTVTSILISRTEPSFNMVKLLSRGLLGKITEEDLRFSREEMVKYLQIQNIKPSPQAISSIYHDTEGWAFAIHLAGLSLKNAPPGTGYVSQAMRSNIFKLIDSEILAVISADLRKFLIKLSLVEHLAVDLIREIAGQKPLFEEMERLSSFIRLDTYLNAYRIHHLLLEYLNGKQEELSEAEKREVYQKAAEWCIQHDQKMDAINYYEKAEDYARIITITYTLPMVLPGHFAWFILKLLDRIPQEVYTQNSPLYIIRARTLVSLSMFDQCERELKELISRTEALPLSPELHRLLMASYANLGFIGILNSTHSKDYYFVDLIKQAAHHAGLTGGYVIEPPVSVMNLGSYICRVYSPEKEEINRFIDAIAETAPYSRALGGCGWGMDDLARAEFCLFKGDVSGAEQFSLQAIRKARDAEQYEIENRALFFLLRISLVQGNYERIQDLFKQMEAQLDKVNYINRFIYYDIITGWYYIQIGRPEKLVPWLKDDFEESDLNTMFHGLEILVKAKNHFAEKRYPAALAALEDRKYKYGAGDFVMGTIEIKILEALCHYRLQDREGAFAALETAYTLALPNALYMPFTEMGKDMRALAEELLGGKTGRIPRAWLETVCQDASDYAKKLSLAAE
ncbi:MAG: helix-turn-helix transcriptional regulator [Treponema sp.]|jgi:LuxR family maltose regulon positive regulatory protein|nr:helix-turn-helix transcriptional regulator [Treponema sp.]